MQTTKTFDNNFSYVTNDDSIEQAVVAKILNRQKQGFKNYGTSMTRTDLSTLDWLKHAQEEAMDMAIYLQRLIQDYGKTA